MHRLIAAVLAAAMTLASPALEQAWAQVNKSTVPSSQSVTTGLTYQTILAPLERFTVTIQNNNVSGDNCWLIINGAGQVTPGSTTTSSTLTIGGVTMTAAKHSILLGPGASYQRYYPYVPKDAFYGTCQGTGDSFYVDTQ